MTIGNECTCADYDPEIYEGDDACRCRRCPETARGAEGCPHRLEEIISGKGDTIGIYNSMCDQCFTQARDVRACGLRIAEHYLNHTASA